MMFVISEVILDKDYPGEDERLELFKLLCDGNPDLGNLQGKKVISRIEDTDEEFTWEELFISPYTIYIEE